MRESIARRVLARVVLGLALIPFVLVAGCGEEDASGPDNDAPVIASVSVVPGTVVVGGSVTVTVTATDADGDDLSYSYVPSGGAISGSGSVVTWTAPLLAGAYSVAVTVSDGNGGEDTAQGSLTVTQETTIHGTVSLPGGVPGNLANGVVSIYASYEDWATYQPAQTVTVTGSGTSVTYSMTDVPAGTWWLDYWLDNDYSTTWSIGDFVGWYGSGTWDDPVLTSFTITQGQVLTRNMTAYLYGS